MINSGYITIPFTTESEHGLESVNGIAKFSAAGVVFEFEKKILGIFGQGVVEMKLPLAEILHIKYKPGFFRLRAKIEIMPTSLSAISGLPRTRGKLILKIRRDYFERGQEAVEKLIKAADQRTVSAPLPISPIRGLFDESEDETKPLDQ